MPTSESGHGDAGNNRRVEIPQEEKNHHHDERDRQHQFELDVGNRSLDGRGKVRERGNVDSLRKVCFQLRQQRLYALHNADGVSARLPLHIYDHRRRLIHPRRQIAVLHSIHNFCDVSKHDRSAVAISDDHVPIVLAGNQLIVGVDLISPAVDRQNSLWQRLRWLALQQCAGLQD